MDSRQNINDVFSRFNITRNGSVDTGKLYKFLDGVNKVYQEITGGDPSITLLTEPHIVLEAADKFSVDIFDEMQKDLTYGLSN